MRFTNLIFILLFLPFAGIAQSHDFWTVYTQSISSDNRQIVPDKYNVFELNESMFKEALARLDNSNEIEISLPLPDGEEAIFKTQYDPIMHADLAATFPQIRTYKVINSKDKGEWGRIDLTLKGFHGIIFSRKGTIYIDPFATDTPEKYIAYYKRDFTTTKSETHSCGVDTNPGDYQMEEGEISLNHYRGGGTTLELRTYRLALAATAEYTEFHGGTVADAMSAMVTTMNRVNGVYERDLSIRMEFVADNDNLIYTSSNSDPYSNGNAGTMLNENHNTCNAVIGGANYDIGHVFGTNSGGVAALGSVCSISEKGRGVTGSGNPVNDPFDIDYVCHEMGHQFAANHTFNNCGGNENFATAMEPGSGSTIMSYAGLCGSDNIQNNSDDYFHVVSLEQILSYTTSGFAYDCAVKTSTDNVGPEVSVISSGFFIPQSTPFELDATATDANNDDLVYCWEQYNVGPLSSLGSPSGNAPSFRSREPSSESNRIFPRFSTIISGFFDNKEVLPSYGRNMDFKVTVRDNNIQGGIVTIEQVSFDVVANAGPFKVSSPDAFFDVWREGESTTITWDVSNTDASPVNCAIVDIFLSTNSGNDFPTQIADDIPNSGSYTFTAPDELTSTARVMIRAADNIFFDISDNDFSIEESTSIDDLNEDWNISLYPNPVSDILHLEIKDAPNHDLILEMYDMRGVLVMAQNIFGNIQTTDISKLAAGMYRVRLRGEDLEWNGKLMVL
jgi:hypothetical protein